MCLQYAALVIFIIKLSIHSYYFIIKSWFACKFVYKLFIHFSPFVFNISVLLTNIFTLINLTIICILLVVYNHATFSLFVVDSLQTNLIIFNDRLDDSQDGTGRVGARRGFYGQKRVEWNFPPMFLPFWNNAAEVFDPPRLSAPRSPRKLDIPTI